MTMFLYYASLTLSKDFWFYVHFGRNIQIVFKDGLWLYMLAMLSEFSFRFVLLVVRFL